MKYYVDGKQVSYVGTDISKYQDYVDFVKLRKAGIDAFNIYLYADVKSRAKRAVELAENGTTSIEKYIEKRDKLRKTYYKQYTGREMGNANNYTICFDTGRINIETCTDVIIEILSREQ